ncbi:MAG: hypothetical protein GY711_34870 [bacterium]|nr:hypothetical protein [bacterium]
MHSRSQPDESARARELRRRFAALEADGDRNGLARRVRAGLVGILPRKAPPIVFDEHGKTFLEISCDGQRITGWVHADASRARGTRTRWRADLTRPWNVPDGHFDGVLLADVSGLLSYTVNLELVSELYRALRCKSSARVTAPCTEEPSAQRSVWTVDSMTELLEAVGFENVTEVAVQAGFAVEGTKPAASEESTVAA